MGGKSSTPTPPNYALAAEMTAESQQQAIDQQTRANRPNQYTPWGKFTWDTEEVWNPVSQQYENQWSQNVDLADPLDAALQAQMAATQNQSETAAFLTDQLPGIYEQGPDFSGMAEFADTPQYNPYNKQANILGYNGDLYNQLSNRQVYQNRARGAQSGTGYDPNELRQQAEDAMYSQATSRLDPEWNQRESDMASQLAAQGLRPGDAAYDRQMANFNRARTDAYNQAKWSASEAGRAEAGQLFGQGLNEAQLYNQAMQQVFGQEQAANAAQQGLRGNELAEQFAVLDQQNRAQQAVHDFEMQKRGFNLENQLSQAAYQNQLRQAQMADEMARRGWTLNEIQALLSGQQVQMPQQPTFTNAGAGSGADYLTAADLGYQADMGQFGAGQAGMGNFFSGLGALGGAAMMFSDRRLKRDIRRIGETPGGIPLYSWTWVWGGDGAGVMADEAPGHAVHVHPSGFLMVDYGEIR